MSSAVQQLIDTFEALSDKDKQQAAVEIIRRVIPSDAGDSPGDALVGSADELFLALDADEAGHDPR